MKNASLIYLLALFSTLGLFADSQIKERYSKAPPSAPQTRDEIGIEIGADFLYWQANQQGMSYGQIFNFFVHIPAPPLVDQTSYAGSFLDLDFRFTPGVRAAFGFQPCHDKWKIDFIWTHLNTKASGASDNPDTVGGPNIVPNFQFLVPQPTGSGTNGINAKGTWWAEYNTIDLDMKRKLPFSDSFNLEAHLGLRNLFLNQKYNIFALKTYGPPFVSSQAKMRQNIWGLGPMIGLDSNWGVYRGFSLFGQASVALLWSHVHSTNKGYVYAAEPVLVDKLLATFHTTMPEFSLVAGGEYSVDINNQCRFSARVGWEFITLINANFLGAVFYPAGDYNMSGLTAGFVFDF